MESILRNSFRVNRPSVANSSNCTRASKGSMALDRPKNFASSRTPEAIDTRDMQHCCHWHCPFQIQTSFNH